MGFIDGVDEPSIQSAATQALSKGRISMILIETPANPTNGLVDIALIRRIADTIASTQHHRPIIACDNTLLGPVFQRPIAHGADISLYSLTKYVGGHSDLVAGAALGSNPSCARSNPCAAPSAPSSTRIPAGCSAAPSKPSPSHGKSRRQRPRRRQLLREHPKIKNSTTSPTTTQLPQAAASSPPNAPAPAQPSPSTLKATNPPPSNSSTPCKS